MASTGVHRESPLRFFERTGSFIVLSGYCEHAPGTTMSMHADFRSAAVVRSVVIRRRTNTGVPKGAQRAAFQHAGCALLLDGMKQPRHRSRAHSHVGDRCAQESACKALQRIPGAATGSVSASRLRSLWGIFELTCSRAHGATGGLDSRCSRG